MGFQLPLNRNLLAWSIAGAVFYWFVYKPERERKPSTRSRTPAVRGAGASDLVLIGGNDLYGKGRVGTTSGATGRRIHSEDERSSS
jgi:hypothetical protein